MRTNLWRLASVLVLLAMLISPLGSAYAAATDKPQTPALKPGMQVIKSSFAGTTQPLRTLAPVKVDPNAPSAVRERPERLSIPKTETAGTGSFDTSILQNGPVEASMPATEANFEGVNNISGVYPPDTQGDVGTDPLTGKKYYVQWVNLAFEIWDVTNPAAPLSVYGPAAGNTLWVGTNTACASINDGDPITQFDHLANRWLMTQFAVPGGALGFHQCVAVSATADPTGSWYVYDFKTSDTLMNDYPHFGVWPDGYYMTVNQFNYGPGYSGDWAGAGVAVFEREALLQGMPARLIYIDTGAVTLNYGGMLPTDLDGPAPAFGTPNYFMEWDDSTWLGDATDTLRVWEFKTDWVTPANTTFGANASYDPNLMLATADVDPALCAGRSCVPQPGTTVGLDGIADRLMYRLQYRNFGSYQTIVGNHTVNAGTPAAKQGGIHWFELRNTGSGFAVEQQGVYASGTNYAWMGSLAMDGSGDMALGYSVSSSTVYPSIRYTGRLAADPAGQMPQGEGELIAGTGVQTGTAYRWGDYSMMAVDSADDCTFWFTSEYIKTTGATSWQTRVGSFKFPSCTTAPTSLVSGTVTDGTNPLAGATVTATGGYTTVTDATGHYELSLVAGTYDFVATKYGYNSDGVLSVTVTPPTPVTEDFVLTPAPLGTVFGAVTDDTTGWPLYARLDIFGYPSSPVFTDPVTGEYSVDLAPGDYTFSVTALSGGYALATRTVSVSAGGPENFAMAADLASCTAPGYGSSNIFADGFDTSTAPAFSATWGVEDVTGTLGDWVTSTASNNPGGWAPHSAPNLAYFNSYDATAGSQTRLYQTSGVDLSGETSVNASVWVLHETQWTNDDTLQMQISTDGGTTWADIGDLIHRNDGTSGWAKHSASIDAYTGAGMTDVRIALVATGDYGNDIHVDDLSIAQPNNCAPLPDTGLVIGAVFDNNTGLPVANPVVQDAALNTALLIDASADTSAPAPQLYVIAKTAGAQTLTATATGYGVDTQTPTVVADDTVGQNFNLPAGQVTPTPTSLTFTATTTAPTGSQTFDLGNTGDVTTGVEIFAIPGTFAGYIPTGPFADHTRHFGPKNRDDKDATAIRDFTAPPSVPAIAAAGDVVTSWNTGLTYGWGLGYNTEASDLWIFNLGPSSAQAGDDLNHRFTTAGVNTGDTIDPTAWLGSFGGDMAYNPFTNTLWQVNVGGDNCVYEMDPAAKVSTGNKICPAFGTSERGLAYNPLTNTYYAGSWNDYVINHFAPDGTILDSVDVGLPISGLAFNPATGHIFVSISYATVSDPAAYDIYVLDANTPGYDAIGGIKIMDGGVRAITDSDEKGLDIDCAGNLWLQAHDATTGSDKAISFASGETGVCDWQASWLTVTPTTGTINAGLSSTFTANLDATGLPGGTYSAYLRVVNDTPYGDTIVPVTLNLEQVKPTATTGAATAKTVIGATLNGTVNANSGSTVVTFEYGTTTAYGKVATAAQSPVSGATDTAVSAAITGLAPNTTYHYRVVATNSGGATQGADMTFKTNALVEKLKNASFEVYPAGSKVPTSWVATKFGVLDGKDGTTKKLGKFSVKITGGGLATIKTLSQTIVGGGKAGYPISLSVWVKGTAVPKIGTCSITVTAYNGVTPKGTKSVNCPTGTFVWKQISTTLTPSGDFTKLIFKITVKKATGTVWFDVASLKR